MNKKVNAIEQLCSVRKLKYYDGREKGEHVIEVDNGVLSFSLLQDRCLDIYSFRHKGTNICFISKNGLCGFNGDFGNVFDGGMLYTCGLDTVGGRAMPIHGKIHNIPATITNISNDGKNVSISAEVRQCGLFQSNLLLKRTISTEFGSGKINIRTEIINEGYKNADYCVLFHMNVGYPMLDAGTTISAPIISTEPRTEYAKKFMDNCLTMDEPKNNNEETVFFHTVKKGNIKVENQKLGKELIFNYDEKMLPNFIEWKSMVSGDYALGIEPSTTTLEDKFAFTSIKPNESHVYEISLEVKDL